MTPRKIAFATPGSFDGSFRMGGGGRYALNMAAGVAEASGGAYEVEVLLHGPSPHREGLGPGVSLRVLPVAYHPRVTLNATSWDLAEAIEDADLVHVHSPMTRPGEMAILAAKQQWKPLFISDHGMQSSTIARELGSLDLADRIVCNSDFGASLCRTRTPIEVIKGGVDTRRFRPPAPRPPRDHLLYVGRLLPHKGVDRLIAALPEGIPLTICGRSQDDAYLDLLKDLAAEKEVDFIPDATGEDLRDLYARAWATVLPSCYQDTYGNLCPVPELMSLSLLESMATGTPAIGSRVGGTPEFIRDGETGFLFETADELAAHIRRIVDEPEMADRMGARAREAAVAEFDLRDASDRLLALYEGAIDGSRGGAG